MKNIKEKKERVQIRINRNQLVNLKSKRTLKEMKTIKEKKERLQIRISRNQLVKPSKKEQANLSKDANIRIQRQSSL